MSGYLTNKRPSSSTDWGVGNSNFAARFIEPTALKKQVGYNDGEAPTAVAFNWLINNLHRWIKNLDERTTKVAVHTWTVNNATDRATDRDFPTLQDALSSSSVQSGDTILVASQETIDSQIVISKSVRIVFTKDSFIYGDPSDESVMIVLNAPKIQISGGSFHTFFGAVFTLDSAAEHCSIEGCHFEDNEEPINDFQVQPGYVPSIRGCTNYSF